MDTRTYKRLHAKARRLDRKLEEHYGGSLLIPRRRVQRQVERIRTLEKEILKLRKEMLKLCKALKKHGINIKVEFIVEPQATISGQPD